jgi:hypothetical protein
MGILETELHLPVCLGVGACDYLSGRLLLSVLKVCGRPGLEDVEPFLHKIVRQPPRRFVCLLGATRAQTNLLDKQRADGCRYQVTPQLTNLYTRLHRDDGHGHS